MNPYIFAARHSKRETRMVRPGWVPILTVSGAAGAKAGGAGIWKGAGRVTFWGAIAMAVTAAIGAVIGSPV